MNPYISTQNGKNKLSSIDLYYMKRNGIVPDMPPIQKTIPEAKEMIKENNDKDEDIMTLKYIIENKPKTKIIREYFKTKCEGIIDDDYKQFENKM